jgi:hypothetical protein
LRFCLSSPALAQPGNDETDDDAEDKIQSDFHRIAFYASARASFLQSVTRGIGAFQLGEISQVENICEANGRLESAVCFQAWLKSRTAAHPGEDAHCCVRVYRGGSTRHAGDK